MNIFLFDVQDFKNNIVDQTVKKYCYILYVVSLYNLRSFLFVCMHTLLFRKL